MHVWVAHVHTFLAVGQLEEMSKTPPALATKHQARFANLYY